MQVQSFFYVLYIYYNTGSVKYIVNPISCVFEVIFRWWYNTINSNIKILGCVRLYFESYYSSGPSSGYGSTQAGVYIFFQKYLRK